MHIDTWFAFIDYRIYGDIIVIPFQWCFFSFCNVYLWGFYDSNCHILSQETFVLILIGLSLVRSIIKYLCFFANFFLNMFWYLPICIFIRYLKLLFVYGCSKITQTRCLVLSIFITRDNTPGNKIPLSFLPKDSFEFSLGSEFLLGL